MRRVVGELAETQELGRRLGEGLFPGAVVALVGPLGAGKTHFTRAVCEGLGVPNSRVVTSPTFVLIQEYEGRHPIAHFDAYRLKSSRDFAELGVEEYFAEPWVSLVEWADRVEAALPSEHLRVTIEVTGETSRTFHVESNGAAYAELIGRLQ